MALIIYRLAVFAIVIGMALPSMGAVLDHHYAERQPGHLHIGTDGYHEHVHAYEVAGHSHVHGEETGGAAFPVVFYNYEAGPTAVTVILLVDADMESFLQYQPTSIFSLPSFSHKDVKNNYIPPPGKPPRLLA